MVAHIGTGMKPLKHHITLVFCIFFCLSQGHLLAQLNLKVGYNGARVNAKKTNEIIDQFNKTLLAQSTNFHDDLNTIKFMHGIEIGLRYRLRNIGFELGWSSISSKGDVYANLVDNKLFQDKWYYSLTEYSAGVENYFGKFGYGASIGYQTYRIKTDITGVQRKKSLIEAENALTSKLYLIFQFPGDLVGIAFKPYVQIPLGKYNISAFDQSLNEQIQAGYQSTGNYEEDMKLFGISILLYNGKQN